MSTAVMRPGATNGSPIEARWRHATNGRERLVSLTVSQYHRMIETGILPEGEPIHLIDGLLVRKDRSKAGGDPMTVGPGHAESVKKLIPLDSKLRRRGCHIQVQQPVTLPPDNEPEPDGAVVYGRPEDYHGRHPGAKDIACVIEVSDSSLRDDRTTMQRIYADHAVPQYVIVNLPEQLVEVYTEPLVGHGRYGRVVTLGIKHRVEINTGARRPLIVAVRNLLS